MGLTLPRSNLDRLCARLALAICVALSLVGPASAHAVLVAATPADRTMLDRAPAEVHLTFDESVALTQLTLVAADGTGIPLKASATNAEVTGVLPGAPLPAGTYTLSYRVISADGHVVGGAIQFGIGIAQGQWRATTDTGIAIQRWELVVLGWVVSIGGFLCFGLPLPWQEPSTARRRSGDGLALLVAAAAIAAIGVQGIAMQGGDALAGMVDLKLWRAGLGSPGSSFAGLVISGVLLQRIAVRAGTRGGRFLHYAAAGLMIVAFATTGHVHALGWQPSLLLAIHVAAALFWVSALPPLLARLGGPEPGAALMRFSRSALAIIAVLVLAGTGLAWLQVLLPGELLATAYGNVLTTKVVLVAILLSLGALNRWKLAPLVRRGDVRALRWTRLSVGAELLLIALILALTAGLGELTPPRHLLAAELAAAARRAIINQMLMDRDAMAMAALFANPDGSYDLEVTFSDGAEQPVRPRQVTAEFTNPTAGIGPIRRDLEPDANGTFRLRALDLAPHGNWRITIKADFSDFDRRIFSLDVRD